MSLTKTNIGDTLEFTFISSGVTFSPIWGAIRDSNESLVSSWSMSSSGNGHYFANVTTAPNSYGAGIYETTMTGYVNSLSYIRKERFQLIEGQS